jgi:hypothetical protein
MQLPSNETLYRILLVLLFGSVILGLVFDTDWSGV